MRVSVLIPVYNGSRYIKDAIESVLSQTFQDFEIIIVDDGSEDETASIVKQYDRIHYMHQEHSGVSTARNRALMEANGELITFLDADDLITPEKFEKQVNYMDTHPECELVFCRYRNFLDLEEIDMTPRHQEIMEKDKLQLLIGAMVRSAVFEKWGGFNQRRNYGEDTEWLAGLEIGGVNLQHFIEEKLYLRRIHAENSSLQYSRFDGMDTFFLNVEAIHRAIRGRNKK